MHCKVRNMIRRVGLSICLLGGYCTHAGEVAPSISARVLRVVVGSGGSDSRVACTDLEVASELKRLGVEIDPLARVAWASSEAELRALLQRGHLVVCGNPTFLSKGAGLVLALEGGRPVIYINYSNVKSSGVILSDSVLKIAKVK